MDVKKVDCTVAERGTKLIMIGPNLNILSSKKRFIHSATQPENPARNFGCDDHSFFGRQLTKMFTLLGLHVDSLAEGAPMTSVKPVKSIAPKKKLQPPITEQEERARLDRNIQIREQRAETQLELAKLFLEKDKPEIALRRLQEIVTEFSGTVAATAANALIESFVPRTSSIRANGIAEKAR